MLHDIKIKECYASLRNALLGYESGLETFVEMNIPKNWEYVYNYVKKNKKVSILSLFGIMGDSKEMYAQYKINLNSGGYSFFLSKKKSILVGLRN